LQVSKKTDHVEVGKILSETCRVHSDLELANGNGNGNGLLFHMTQPTSRSIIKAIACSKPTISEHQSKWKQWHNS